MIWTVLIQRYDYTNYTNYGTFTITHTFMVTLTILPDHLNLYVLCKKAYYPTDVS